MARYAVIFALVACVVVICAQASKDQSGPECGCVCKRHFKPVCGKTSDNEFKRFHNKCLLACENTCHNKDYAETDISSCSTA